MSNFIMREFGAQPNDGRKIIAFCVGFVGAEIEWMQEYGRWGRVDMEENGKFVKAWSEDCWNPTHVMFEITDEEVNNCVFGDDPKRPMLLESEMAQ